MPLSIAPLTVPDGAVVATTVTIGSVAWVKPREWDAAVARAGKMRYGVGCWFHILHIRVYAQRGNCFPAADASETLVAAGLEVYQGVHNANTPVFFTCAGIVDQQV